ncbi:S8 family peptidase [Nocardiopsis potens]|uniref:S8 family peptidase n=1 Tax=Nocardiopsis potens TaxID=1246458 RepID=UPI0003717195|nr:S8 family serine peptidase [Nocardiopsis potens]
MRTRQAGTHLGRGLAAVPLLAAVIAAQAGAGTAAADTGSGGLLREQWALEAIGAQEAWDAGGSGEAGDEEAGRGGGATVAIVGTGVDTDHPDLRGEVTAGTDFSGGPGEGADGSSTALAGIAAARGHGKEHLGGVLGSAPGAGLLSVRVAPEGGEAADADALEQGIRYAADEGAQVVVVAEGVSAGQEGAGVADAVGDAVRSGALVLLPAGDPVAEAAGDVEGALTVGAVGESLAPAAGGTPGGAGAGADLLAPGAGVDAIAAGGDYAEVSGDDAAAALAGGVGALVRAAHPQLLPAQAAEALTAGAENGVLSAPGAVREADAAAEGVPLYDEDLVTEDDGLPVPAWTLWTAGGVLLIALAVVGVVLFRRATRNPYDLPEDEPVEVPAAAAEQERTTRSIGRRRKGAGRRRK